MYPSLLKELFYLLLVIPSQFIFLLGDSVAARQNILGNSVASDIISQDILSPPGYIVASCEVGGIAVSDVIIQR